MLFLVYLTRTGIIDAETALELLRRREAQQIPLGRIALEAGLLKIPQVFQILKHTAETRQRFGEAGVSLGMLRREQVLQLLGMQQDRLPSISEMLVEMDLCDADELPALMERFQAWRGQETSAA